MKDKINLAELLKDCPKGMELYSPIYGLGILTRVTDRIYVKFPKEHNEKCFKHDGKVSADGEIMLFPKGKTTWEGFVPSCNFKDGDIISDGNYIAIFYKIGTPCYCTSPNIVYYHCYYSQKFCTFKNKLDYGIGVSTAFKYATEEEKEKLFQAIKDNGYKWNSETKTFEKLVKPRFNVGDIIQDTDSYKVKITEVNIEDEYYEYKSMIAKGIGSIGFDEQDNWKLVPNKFDINTLKPFDKVLVRDFDNTPWEIEFFSRLLNGEHFKCLEVSYVQCIPYEGNQHLLGTTNDCSEFYKTW
jgi:hypothetical protein